MSKLIEGKIECPFYLKEGNSFIKCEGGICGTECVHRFKDNTEKQNMKQKFAANAAAEIAYITVW